MAQSGAGWGPYCNPPTGLCLTAILLFLTPAPNGLQQLAPPSSLPFRFTPEESYNLAMKHRVSKSNFQSVMRVVQEPSQADQEKLIRFFSHDFQEKTRIWHPCLP